MLKMGISVYIWYLPRMSLHMNVEVPVIFKAAYKKDPVYNMNVSIYIQEFYYIIFNIYMSTVYT